MESIADQVKTLIDRKLFSTAVEVKECNVDEESDMYGFSLISQREDRRELGRGQRQTSILAKLMVDQNWNNPGAVCLMCRAYQINDTYHSISFGNAFTATKDTYKTLKSEQHAMFADRYYAEGMVAKGRGLFIESVKSFSDALLYSPNHLQARIERADSYYRQNSKAEALDDYKHVLLVQPNCTVVLERVALLRDNTSFSTPHTTGTSTTSSRIQLTDPNAHTTLPSFPSSSALSDTSSKNIHAKPLVYKTQGLIGKIQQSLLDNPAYFDSSSSDSSSESDSDSGSEKSSKKRKHKSSKKDKRSHSDKSSKKRKSKHKKDKHSKRRKHKSDK